MKQLHAIMAVTYVAEVRSDTHIDVNKFIFVHCWHGTACTNLDAMQWQGTTGCNTADTRLLLMYVSRCRRQHPCRMAPQGPASRHAAYCCHLLYTYRPIDDPVPLFSACA